MILSLLLSIFTPLLLGFVLISFLWPDQRPFRYFIIKGSIATGLGIGFFSIVFFIWLLVFGTSKNFILFERVLLVPLLISLYYAFKKYRNPLPVEVRDKPSIISPSPPLEKGGWGDLKGYFRSELFVKIVFYLTFLFSLLAFIFVTLRNPHGGWDAWAIWNMRARFIFRSGEHWQNAFSNLLGWSHPDYPLLIPLSIIHGWVNIGGETSIMPAILAMIFTFSTVLLLLSSLIILRSETQGLLAGLILLGTPFFIRHGATQYADVPLGFFFLLTMVLLAFYDRTSPKSYALLFLAGISAGFSAWTKNEGLLFLISIIAAHSLVIIRMKGWKTLSKEMVAFFIGLIPVLLIIIYLKIYIAPANDLLSAQGFTTFSKLIDPARYFLILKEYIITGITFTRYGLPLLAIYLLLLGINRKLKDNIIVKTAIITLVLMLAGYFFVYVTTPQDLSWHLKTSLNRLFLQLWPSVIFLF
jgi:hypothetical protein